jgi:hypothetical protein
MALAEPVLAAAHAYCVAIDERAPKLLEGLYLSGSIALGDFCPGQSDLDFVAVTNRKLDAAITTVLERLHVDLSSIGGRPQLDGLYVTREDLKRDPRTIEPGLRVNGARLCISRDHRDPITWTTLARYGIPFHGPAVSTLEVWDDRDAVVRWCLANLQDYWRRWRNRSARLASPAGLVSLSAWAAAWGVLGISRIHLRSLKVGSSRRPLRRIMPSPPLRSVGGGSSVKRSGSEPPQVPGRSTGPHFRAGEISSSS